MTSPADAAADTAPEDAAPEGIALTARAGVPAGPARAGSAGRVTRRREQTRRRVLDAALEVFAEQGLGRTTVEDVCGRAGYTRGAFYSNFSSLEELFAALYQDRAERVVAVTAAVLAPVVAGAAARAGQSRAGRSRGGDRAEAAQGLSWVVDLLLEALPDDRQWYLVSAESTAQALRHPELRAAVVERRRALRGALLPALREIVAVVDPDRAGDAAALDRLVRAVVAVHEGMSAQVLLEPDDEQLPALRRQLLLASVGVLDDPPRPAAT